MNSRKQALTVLITLLTTILLLASTSAAAQDPGDSLPATMKLERLALPVEQLPGGEPAKSGAEAASPNGPDTPAFPVITSEDFEGAFPSPGWTVRDDDGATNGEYYWGTDNYRPHGGSWSGWAAAGGADGYGAAAGYYPNNVESTLQYGPFDLSDTSIAELTFYYWLDTELDHDYLEWWVYYMGAPQPGGQRFSGNSGGWQFHTVDLTNVPDLGDATGHSLVWFTFSFTSDGSGNNFAGVFLDDIVLQKDMYYGANLTPYAMSGWDYPIVPSSVTGTNTVNTLFHSQETYIDWAFTNNGTALAYGPFTSCLYLDGSEFGCYELSQLGATATAYGLDHPRTIPAPEGWHTLMFVTDVYDDIPETDETDNSWGMDFYWHTAGPEIGVAPYLFDFTLPADGTDSGILNLGNLGLTNLDWSIDIYTGGTEVPGDWSADQDWQCDGAADSVVITFNEDGSFTTSSGRAGTWGQNDNQILYTDSANGDQYSGHIAGDHIAGTQITSDGSETGCWEASRVVDPLAGQAGEWPGPGDAEVDLQTIGVAAAGPRSDGASLAANEVGQLISESWLSAAPAAGTTPPDV
ncbi:MAG: CARDB domain-containing protein, partial [Chloroflexota bacterium]